MDLFKITAQQVQVIGDVLLEMPAKTSLKGIDILRSLERLVVDEINVAAQNSAASNPAQSNNG